MTTATLIAVGGSIAWLIMVVWSMWAAYLAYYQFRPQRNGHEQRSPAKKQLQSQQQGNLIGVTILRPLRGMDCCLAENLRSSMEIEYDADRDGPLQILFSVADERDEAVEIARKVIAQYPDRDARLIVGDELVGVNPKVNNLVRSWQQAKHDIVWICDSNVYTEPDTLQYAVQAFRDDVKVGLVHHTPQGLGGESSLGAQLEQHFLNTAHAKIYLVINWIGTDSCVMGKSTLVRKSQLDRVGGIAAFGKYMAEDNMIGIAVMKQLHLRHHMSQKTAKQSLVKSTISDYVMRRSRWTRIRAYSMPGVTILEPFTESILSGIVGAWSLSYLMQCSFWLLFLLHMIIWFACDWILVRNLTREPINKPVYYTYTWLLRELSAIPIYLYALLGSNRVVWRNRAYRLKMNGLVEPVVAADKLDEAAKLSWETTYAFNGRLKFESFFILDLLILLVTTIYGVVARITTGQSSQKSSSSQNENSSRKVKMQT